MQKIVCGFLLWSAGLASAQNLDSLENLVGQWMALRKSIAVEELAGREQLDHYAREKALLLTEREHLMAEIDSTQSGAQNEEQDTANLLELQNLLMQSESELESVLDRVEAKLNVWQPLVPPALRDESEALFAKLPAPDRSAEVPPLSERVQTVVALLTSLENLQNSIHSVTEVLETKDGRRQVDVLYIGLAQAFAVAPGNNWAAIGHPAADGWHWTLAPEWADSIRRAHRLYSREETADLISLPLQLAPEVRP